MKIQRKMIYMCAKPHSRFIGPLYNEMSKDLYLFGYHYDDLIRVNLLRPLFNKTKLKL